MHFRSALRYVTRLTDLVKKNKIFVYLGFDLNNENRVVQRRADSNGKKVSVHNFLRLVAVKSRLRREIRARNEKFFFCALRYANLRFNGNQFGENAQPIFG